MTWSSGQTIVNLKEKFQSQQVAFCISAWKNIFYFTDVFYLPSQWGWSINANTRTLLSVLVVGLVFLELGFCNALERFLCHIWHLIFLLSVDQISSVPKYSTILCDVSKCCRYSAALKNQPPKPASFEEEEDAQQSHKPFFLLQPSIPPPGSHLLPNLCGASITSSTQYYYFFLQFLQLVLSPAFYNVTASFSLLCLSHV